MAADSEAETELRYMQPVEPPIPLSPAVTISVQAFEAIREELQTESPELETGGILLGHDEGAVISVLHAGAGGPHAVRQTRHFLRDLAFSQLLALDKWYLDSSEWIGEWHSHPSGELIPSPTDFRSYLTHLADEELRFSRFISIIVCTDGESFRAAAWVVASTVAIEVPLVLHNEE